MSVQQSQNCAFLCPLFVNLFLRLANLFSFSSTFFVQRDCQVFVCDSSIGDVITTIDCKNPVSAVKWISENRIAVSSFDGTIRIFEMDESNLATTRLVKEFTHGKRCYYLEWNARTQYLASAGTYQINIWSMDNDMPIYSLELPERPWKRSFAWRLCTGNEEEKDGIEMARKSAKNFTFFYQIVCLIEDLFKVRVYSFQRESPDESLRLN
ncbi:hypothetical protein GHT06_012286 [Daphnia sinensis]|uniref:WD repeat-containing protein 55 homolog n=1 Tax=Daphnia sinensis TaxID=1820382 RepID=A0AAD5PZP8_9CRUS|nr:hypothetical protein GHT06_012286 [Daphnia sinensis]